MAKRGGGSWYTSDGERKGPNTDRLGDLPVELFANMAPFLTHGGRAVVKRLSQRIRASTVDLDEYNETTVNARGVAPRPNRGPNADLVFPRAQVVTTDGRGVALLPRLCDMTKVKKVIVDYARSGAPVATHAVPVAPQVGPYPIDELVIKDDSLLQTHPRVVSDMFRPRKLLLDQGCDPRAAHLRAWTENPSFLERLESLHYIDSYFEDSEIKEGHIWTQTLLAKLIWRSPRLASIHAISPTAKGWNDMCLAIASCRTLTDLDLDIRCRVNLLGLVDHLRDCPKILRRLHVHTWLEDDGEDAAEVSRGKQALVSMFPDVEELGSTWLSSYDFEDYIDLTSSGATLRALRVGGGYEYRVDWRGLPGLKCLVFESRHQDIELYASPASILLGAPNLEAYYSREEKVHCRELSDLLAGRRIFQNVWWMSTVFAIVGPLPKLTHLQLRGSNDIARVWAMIKQCPSLEYISASPALFSELAKSADDVTKTSLTLFRPGDTERKRPIKCVLARSPDDRMAVVYSSDPLRTVAEDPVFGGLFQA